MCLCNIGIYRLKKNANQFIQIINEGHKITCFKKEIIVFLIYYE